MKKSIQQAEMMPLMVIVRIKMNLMTGTGILFFAGGTV